MAERKADELAGKGSLLDKLRKRREQMESGDYEEPKQMNDAPDMQAGTDDRRGYTKESWGS